MRAWAGQSQVMVAFLFFPFCLGSVPEQYLQFLSLLQPVLRIKKEAFGAGYSTWLVLSELYSVFIPNSFSPYYQVSERPVMNHFH